MRKNPWAAMRKELAVLHKIVDLLTDEELAGLCERQRSGPITGLDASVMERLKRLIVARQVEKSVKEGE